MPVSPLTGMAAQTARTMNSAASCVMTLTSESTAPAALDCRVVELRQYTLHPGRRDTLIELFDCEFVDSQDAVGIHVLGQFRDFGNEDRLSGCVVLPPASRSALHA